MPQTPKYGFEYETAQSVPGVTLTTGPSGNFPLLAQQVEDVISTLEARISALESTGFRFLTTVYFTSNGVFDKLSYTGLKAIRVKAVGAGGGGGGASVTTASQWSAGGGGAGGAYAESFILTANFQNSTAVTVGSGGAGGTGLNAGTAGGDSSFGNLVVANGGGPGSSELNTDAQMVPGGVGGLAINSTGDIVIDGGDGFHAGAPDVSAITTPPYGGASAGGYGMDRRASSSSGGAAGVNGKTYGGGGTGAINDQSEASNLTGGAGADGVVIIDVYV